MLTIRRRHPVLTGVRRLSCSAALRLGLLALGCTLFIELFNHKVFTSGFASFWKFAANQPLAIAVNVLIVYLTFVPVFFFKRRIFYIVLVAALWLACGCVNGFILINRMTPFTIFDLSMAKSALLMLPSYLSPPLIVLLAIAIVVLVFMLVFLFVKGRKEKQVLRKRLICGLAALVIVGCLLAGCLALAFRTGQLSSTFPNLAFAYEDYGVSYCFLQTFLNQGVDRMEGYDAQSVDKLRKRLTDNESKSAVFASSGGEAPNIVYVQLESFIDPKEMNNLTLSGEAAPNWTALASEYSTGYLSVPVIGAGTANTECEILTGMSTQMFGPGEYPYKTCLTEQPVESIAFNLKEYGYAAHAVHNYHASFYNRDTVFANFGFDSFTSLEYMPRPEMTPNNWSHDDILTGYTLKALESTPDCPDFVFTISVQGHGKYPTESVLENPAITVLDCPDEEMRWAYEYYVNQVYEMDAFIGELVAGLSARDEKTVLVFYGDHLPALQLEAGDLRSESLYKTQYIIWDNFGLARQNADLPAYRLTADVLERLNVSGGYINRLHQQHSGSSDYLNDLQLVQYDILYGAQHLYEGQSPYSASDLQLGIEPIAVTSVSAAQDGWLIGGLGFSPYCEIEINGRSLATEYISPQLLKITDDPETSDPAQVSVLVVNIFNETMNEECN